MSKREHLVSVAFDLFYRHGVHAVGINRVLEVSGVAKKTLYHHFASKEDLVAATVDYRDRRFTAWLTARVDNARSGRAALVALFEALDDWFNQRDEEMQPFHGCFFINVSAEFGDLEHPIHRQCAHHKQSIAELIRRHVAQVIDDPRSVESVSEAVIMLKEGAIVQAHVMGDLKAGVKARAAAERLLDAMANPGGAIS
ncbi:TetR/AcrR family transcriptional regulator [Marinobacter fonticola]|uniref:TetR/AcrR family transcriptional regulator n=1 Tax=Marinobacter fonticola TaxID=2603215 RepID=UPI0011E6D2B7|nr:TetR/AcrR family transcriptional regulator [Marinobacter fonticola]